MAQREGPVALVTGGSRGIGAATALALARRGYHVALTYRNKAARAEQVAEEIRRLGRECLPLGCDITSQDDLDGLFGRLRPWSGRLNVLVLNASGGLERDLVAAHPGYPMRINRDAQVAVVQGALPLMSAGGTVVFVTSHWAHLHGSVEQLPHYEPVAESKWAGEQELRARQGILSAQGIRLIIVTGDLVEGTITPRLLERASPGMSESRRDVVGSLPTTDQMGDAIAAAATDESLVTGRTVVVGGALESLQSPPV